MTRNCLVVVFAAHNMLPAAAAVRHFGNTYHAGQSSEITLLLHMPGWSSAQLEQIKDLVAKQAASQGWSRIIVLDEAGMQDIIQSPEQAYTDQSINRFQKVIGLNKDQITEVYYSHDVVGYAAQLAMRAYPNATAITYGESMGLMEDKDYIIASVTGAGWDEDKVKLRPKREEPKASKAVLILPADQTGDCLDGMDLLVVPRQLALDIIADFQKFLPELVVYSKQLIENKKQPLYVFVVNNLADANFMSAEKEAQMYAEMIHAHCLTGSSIIIKGHPLATHKIDQMIVNILESDYDASYIDPQFSRYPMEIWQDLLNAGQLISLSYCSISVEYLYQKPVIYSIDKNIIHKYMDEKVWNRLTDGDEFFRMQREALKTWDGKGVLCSGKRVSFPSSKQRILQSMQDPQRAQELNHAAIDSFQKGEFAEACRLFSDGISHSPADFSLINNLATSLWQSGNQQQALVYFMLAHIVNPDDRITCLNCLQVLNQLGYAPAAKSLAYKLLSKNPDDPDIYGILKSIQ